MTTLQEEILKLKEENDAIILAHYYQPLEIQDIADAVGDSFALAQKAQKTEKSTIILCGVKFMAESAKILNPNKTVYLPNENAGCPMADMVTEADVLKLREEYPEAAVVCYVNSSAEVKAVSDVCCTSSSAERIVSKLPNKQIIFVPDQNLGSYVATKLPEKEVILFSGFCPIHHAVSVEDALSSKEKNPNAKLLVHPECPKAVLAHADYIGSTAGILEYARKNPDDDLVIGTELGVYQILCREYPGRNISLIRQNFLCVNMKKTTLEDVLACLEGERDELLMNEETRQKAAASLERMVNM